METNRYHTTNTDYGRHWEGGKTFQDSFTQSTPYKRLVDHRAVLPCQLPLDRTALALTDNPEHPCGIMSFSNVPSDSHGQFTNTRRDFQATGQGLMTNACFNTPGATIDRNIGTYSNLQGAWSRVGPSTYDAVHGTGDWANAWGVSHSEPATFRSLHDHRNVDPRDNRVAMEPTPQNMHPL